MAAQAILKKTTRQNNLGTNSLTLFDKHGNISADAAKDKTDHRFIRVGKVATVMTASITYPL